MIRTNSEFGPLPKLDSADPQDHVFARREYHERNLRLDVVQRQLATASCPLNPSWYATYCDGCRKRKPGHFNKKDLQIEAETLTRDVKELKCFLQRTDGQMDGN